MKGKSVARMAAGVERRYLRERKGPATGVRIKSGIGALLASRGRKAEGDRRGDPGGMEMVVVWKRLKDGWEGTCVQGKVTARGATKEEVVTRMKAFMVELAQASQAGF